MHSDMDTLCDLLGGCGPVLPGLNTGTAAARLAPKPPPSAPNRIKGHCSVIVKLVSNATAGNTSGTSTGRVTGAAGIHPDPPQREGTKAGMDSPSQPSGGVTTAGVGSASPWAELYTAHTTWSGFEDMTRIFKLYDLPFSTATSPSSAQAGSSARGTVPGRRVAFSSYVIFF